MAIDHCCYFLASPIVDFALTGSKRPNELLECELLYFFVFHCAYLFALETSISVFNWPLNLVGFQTQSRSRLLTSSMCRLALFLWSKAMFFDLSPSTFKLILLTEQYQDRVLGDTPI